MWFHPINTRLITEFQRWLAVSGLSRDSQTSYASTILKYCTGRAIKEVNDKKFFAELTDRLRGEERKLATISRHTFALKKFLCFLNDEYGLPIINLFSIKCRKSPRPNPVYLEKGEIETIRRVSVATLTDFRDRAIFEFLLNTGCRVSEAVGVDWQKIDFGANEVMITGKGNKQRVVFLGESTNWIKRYLARRKVETEPLFLNQYDRRLNRAYMGIAIRGLGRRAGLVKKIYPHLLRATFATHMIRAGVDPRTLQEMLGHEDIETTLRHYIGVSHEHMKLTHANFIRVLQS